MATLFRHIIRYLARYEAHILDRTLVKWGNFGLEQESKNLLDTMTKRCQSRDPVRF